eukprot:365417-Chlamydomonas_euryale.AAC.8
MPCLAPAELGRCSIGFRFMLQEVLKTQAHNRQANIKTLALSWTARKRSPGSRLARTAALQLNPRAATCNPNPTLALPNQAPTPPNTPASSAVACPFASLYAPSVDSEVHSCAWRWALVWGPAGPGTGLSRWVVPTMSGWPSTAASMKSRSRPACRGWWHARTANGRRDGVAGSRVDAAVRGQDGGEGGDGVAGSRVDAAVRGQDTGSRMDAAVRGQDGGEGGDGVAGSRMDAAVRGQDGGEGGDGGSWKLGWCCCAPLLLSANAHLMLLPAHAPIMLPSAHATFPPPPPSAQHNSNRCPPAHPLCCHLPLQYFLPSPAICSCNFPPSSPAICPTHNPNRRLPAHAPIMLPSKAFAQAGDGACTSARTSRSVKYGAPARPPGDSCMR